ncbi:MAG: cupin domain-containing protein [Acidimicrobiia bacterium]|jgi:quercetin dioxygenase-like cupin family protein
MAGSNGTPKKGVAIYRATDAVDLQKTDFMATPTMTDEVREQLTGAITAGSGVGAEVTVLVRQSDEEGGFSLVHCWFKADYPLPRHSHDADCMYYVISGEAHLGNQVLKAGDSFYIPADAPYVYNAGPDGVEVLEIRHNTASFDMKILEQPAARWQALVDTTNANRDRWTAEQTSPTIAANQA